MVQVFNLQIRTI